MKLFLKFNHHIADWQTVHMANSASLILLDWFTGGAKDEKWELNRYATFVRKNFY